MTALTQYERLESPGIWRDGPEAQRRDVIVVFGDATLVITELRSERTLAHWSLPALRRLNPGKRPALYTPGEGGDEELEIEDDTMIAAIEKVHAAIEATRPHPGRLRAVLLGGAMVLLAGLGVFWMPGALRSHAAAVVPFSKRIEIGTDVLADLSRVTGAPCAAPAAEAALDRIVAQLFGEGRIVVLPEALTGVRRLPGGIFAIGRDLIEDHDTPDVAIGHLLAAEIATGTVDPLMPALEWAGLGAGFRLLTTGNLPPEALRGYGEALLRTPPPRPADDALLAGFAAVGVAATPYAFAIDPGGESVLGLIEADPFRGSIPAPLISDGEWVSVQAICDGE